MVEQGHKFDAIVIGGGFYGAAIAIYLAKNRGFKKICLIEKESDLLTRASYSNQARVHNGYHYPRSFTTAYRSRVNLPRFITDWPDAIKKDFTKLYAIAKPNSKVTSKQFVKFCNDIGAKVSQADKSLKGLFEPRLIENVFLVEEYAFDTTKLAVWALNQIKTLGVMTRLQSEVIKIMQSGLDSLSVVVKDYDGNLAELSASYVFNCTYSGLNQLGGEFPTVSMNIKQEITEMALIKMPKELSDIGITVMDGPFFSIMPFPARGLHTVSHVRYTPHLSWIDEPGLNPYKVLQEYNKSTRFDRMLRDIRRYLPAIDDSKYIDSLFEVKTVLVKNEGDDGRPILFEKHNKLPKCYSILGGKIDNIYDVLEKLDSEYLL